MLLFTFLLLFCHWCGDYTRLSTPKMLAAKAFGKPFLPILQHATVHGLLMMTVLFFYTSILDMFLLVLFQILTHFVIDVWKGRMNGWFPKLQNMDNPMFWTLLGFDQLLHQIVILLMAYYVFL